MRILYDNKFLGATLVPYTENPDYPSANMQDTRLSRVYRTLGLIDENIVITGTIAASYVAILGHNLSESATIKLQGNATNSWGSPSFETILTWNSEAIVKFFTEATYAYWRIYINDPSNTHGYIEIALCFLGTYLQMPGMKPDQAIPLSTTSENDISSSGQNFGDEGYEYREATINFPFLTDTQRKNIITMFRLVKNVTPVIMLIWDSDLTFESPIYCVIDQKKLDFKRSGSINLPWATSLQIREVF